VSNFVALRIFKEMSLFGETHSSSFEHMKYEGREEINSYDFSCRPWDFQEEEESQRASKVSLGWKSTA